MYVSFYRSHVTNEYVVCIDVDFHKKKKKKLNVWPLFCIHRCFPFGPNNSTTNRPMKVLKDQTTLKKSFFFWHRHVRMEILGNRLYEIPSRLFLEMIFQSEVYIRLSMWLYFSWFSICFFSSSFSFFPPFSSMPQLEMPCLYVQKHPCLDFHSTKA